MCRKDLYCTKYDDFTSLDVQKKRPNLVTLRIMLLAIVDVVQICIAIHN